MSAEPSRAPASPPASSVSSLSIQRGTRAGRRRGVRWGWALLGVAAVAAAAGYYFFVPHALDVQTASVVATTPSQQFVQLTASGYVVAQRRAAVASKASGRLIELNVREGSVVKQGEVLARLDASDIQTAIRGAQAAVARARANLLEARVQSDNASADYKRQQGLQAQGFISPQGLEAYRAKAEAAHADVVAAQAALEEAQAQLQTQQVNADYTEIRAPFDGVILVKNANVGDMITPMSSAAGAQGAVVTMADMSTLEVEADVSESNLSRTGVGQPVEIMLDALPGRRFRGHVASIVPTVDRAKATVMTKIQFDHLDPAILPEMSAKVSFLSQRPTDAQMKAVLAVNPRAIVQRGGHDVVFRLSPEADSAQTYGVQAVPVTPQATLGDVREVAPIEDDALKAGDRIVVDPPAGLDARERVKPAVAS